MPARIALTLLLGISLLGCCVPIFVAPDPPSTMPAAPRIDPPVAAPAPPAREPLPSPLLTPYDPEKERKALEREKARLPSRKTINAGVASSLYKSAVRLQGEGETDRATFLLEKILRDFPAAAEAKDAAKRLKEIQR